MRSVQGAVPDFNILIRAIVNTLTVEELNKWRKKCAENVQVSAELTNLPG